MVKFSRSFYYLFGCLVNYSAFQFSIYSAIWIRPSVPVRNFFVSFIQRCVLKFQRQRPFKITARFSIQDIHDFSLKRREESGWLGRTLTCLSAQQGERTKKQQTQKNKEKQKEREKRRGRLNAYRDKRHGETEKRNI